MSRSVTQDYPPKGATMPRYSEALQDVLAHVTPPLPGVTSGALRYGALPAEPATLPVDVEVIIHRDGKTLPVVRYANVPLSVVIEATEHINDNSDGVV